MSETIVEKYQRAKADTRDFLVVKGRFSGTERLNFPRCQHVSGPFETTTRLRFTGRSLSKSGFSQRFAQSVTLELGCIASWGPMLNKADAPMIAILERIPVGYRLVIGACGGLFEDRNVAAEARRLVSCHRDGVCD